jgi:hypothetical protein
MQVGEIVRGDAAKCMVTRLCSWLLPAVLYPTTTTCIAALPNLPDLLDGRAFVDLPIMLQLPAVLCSDWPASYSGQHHL